jgi:hypothetical protein
LKTPKNIPEEVKPCATMIITPEMSPIFVWDKMAPITRAIWATEEYAIIVFLSNCRRHNSLTQAPPNILNKATKEPISKEYQFHEKTNKP